MSLLPKVQFHLRSFFAKRKLDEQLSEEIRTHVEMATEANITKGMSPKEARYAALREFGNVAGIQERARNERGWVWLEQLQQDGRYAFRQLARSPGFTTVVVLTLALGIGATTAIYSVVNTVILNPVGGPEPERMVQITQREVLGGMELFQGVSPPVLEALLGQHGQFTDLAWSDWCQLERKTDEFVKMEYGAYVSPNFFSVLGVSPLLGRDFLPDEAVRVVDGQPVADAAILLSYAWWQSAWGGDRQILGRSLELSGRHFTVVGIMPPYVRFPDYTTPFWVAARSIATTPVRGGMRAPITKIVARLRPDSTLARTQALLSTMARGLMIDHPGSDVYGGVWRMNPRGLEILVQPLSIAFQGGGIWPQLRQTLFGLVVAIGLVLLIVCANVANLALARVERRQHELAVRSATGASRGRLMRQLLTENLILALLGGAASLVVTTWALRVLMALNGMPRLRPVEMDVALLGITFMVSALTGIAFGLAPVWRGGQVGVSALLADGGMNATGGRQRSRYRNTLVVVQLAITVVLLTGAGLMLSSVSRLLRTNPGFDPQNLLLMEVMLPWRKYDVPPNGAELKALFFAQLQERLEALPGVQAVGFEQRDARYQFQIEGHRGMLFAEHANVSMGSGDWFRAMRAPLLAGRYFMSEDAAQERLVVVNEAMAQQFWPREEAVGKKLLLAGSANDAMKVIGVMRDARIGGYENEIQPTFYHPMQVSWNKTHIIGGLPPKVVIRTKDDPALIIPLVRRELKSIEPTLMLPTFRLAQQILFDSTVVRRTYRNYLGFFAGLGLLLSALGIYGVLAYSVARRTREIGIRLAIGAEGRQVRAMIMRQGAGLIASGVVTGLGASLILTRFLQSQLYQTSPNDPLVTGAVVVLLSLVALAACWLPARRAAKVDPVIALRAE